MRKADCAPSWNAPILLASRTITSPIAVGCTVVFKASELCPKTHYCICEAWTEAGLPNGVLNVIQTKREDAPGTTEALIAHREIRKIEFIGSRAVGRYIAQMAAKHTKPVFMELGGKSAAIVLDDANLEQAADLCLKGGKSHPRSLAFGTTLTKVSAFLHHGQICFSTERILVQNSIAENFMDILRRKSKNHSAGMAVTPQMAEAAQKKLLDAEQKGAQFLFGGPGYAKKSGLIPSIMTGVNETMTVFDEETFGPSASLYTFQDDDEAIALANNSEYGLNAAIHTTNMERGIDMGRELEVGQVHINNLTEYDEGKHLFPPPLSLRILLGVDR